MADNLVVLFILLIMQKGLRVLYLESLNLPSPKNVRHLGEGKERPRALPTVYLRSIR
jgi:hypothetical protein